MIRFALALIIVGSALALIARSADVPNPEPPKAAPVYVKIIWPVDTATVREQDRPGIESWVAKEVKNRPEATLTAVTGWVPLVESRYEATTVWDGKVDGLHCACVVSADIVERKGGRIKIVLRGWNPSGDEVTLTLADEPGSREVAPVTKAATKHGIPHVAVFVGVSSK
jgi:hypothetical protein